MPNKLGLIFLREFTKELIANSGTSEPQFFHTLSTTLPINISPEIVPAQTQQKRPMEIVARRPMPMMMPRIPFPPRQIPRMQQPQIPNPIMPVPQPMPQNLNLGKLSMLVNDMRVSIIECPGANKLLIAKSAGIPSVTQISLTEDEIKNIIDQFSRESKIPIIGGLFKVAVGNLLMTAVISELVGSRFIIQKITPQFLMEQNSI